MIATRIFLFISTLVSLYIIGSAGLEVLPGIGSSSNAKNLNNVMLNLSYSYFAGVIFYFFFSYLPQFIQRRKIQPIIDGKVLSIKNQAAAFINSFNMYPINDNMINRIKDSEISKLFGGDNLNRSSYYSAILGLNMSNADYINLTRDKIIRSVEDILFYKEYLSYQQILILEQIKESKFLFLFKRPDIYKDRSFQTICANEFIALLKLIRQI